MPIHIYHYNTNSEQRFFLGAEHRDLYNLIGFNGNIVSHTPAGIAAFISNVNKEYYIDPQTHAFQHSTINLKRNISNKEETPEYDFKPSIQTLARERLKGIFENVIDLDEPISWRDFFKDDKINHSLIEETCNNIFDFQRNILQNELDDETKELLGEDIDSYTPKFLIPPYFYISKPNNKEWLIVNESFYKYAKDSTEDIQIYYALVISKDIIFSDFSEEIVASISKLNPDGIILWIDSFVEEDLTANEILGYIDFLKKIKIHTENILNIHGGYLSTLLCHSELDEILSGFGHSINYGENRSVIPVGGGIPMARFYYPSIHSRLRHGDAYEIMREMKYFGSVDKYRSKVCSCAQCIQLIDNNDSIEDAFIRYGDFPVTFRRSGSLVRFEYPTKEAKEFASKHYLYVKAKEFNDITNKSIREINEELKNTYKELSVTSSSFIGHLDNWSTIIERLF